jgi:hypothetical protein
MPVRVTRKNVMFEPDSSRVIARLLYSNDERSISLVNRIMELSPKRQQEVLTEVLRDYSKRHRSISKIFEKHFNKMAAALGPENIDVDSFTMTKMVLFGDYCTI